MNIEVGDLIQDIEDSDCYYQGLVVQLNPLKYKITKVVWDGEEDDSKNGNVTELVWWQLFVFKNNKWINYE